MKKIQYLKENENEVIAFCEKTSNFVSLKFYQSINVIGIQTNSVTLTVQPNDYLFASNKNELIHCSKELYDIMMNETILEKNPSKKLPKSYWLGRENTSDRYNRFESLIKSYLDQGLNLQIIINNIKSETYMTSEQGIFKMILTLRLGIRHYTTNFKFSNELRLEIYTDLLNNSDNLQRGMYVWAKKLDCSFTEIKAVFYKHFRTLRQECAKYGFANLPKELAAQIITVSSDKSRYVCGKMSKIKDGNIYEKPVNLVENNAKQSKRRCQMLKKESRFSI